MLASTLKAEWPLQEEQLVYWGARRTLLSSGDLYMNRELQEWKLGPPSKFDLTTDIACFGSPQTVYGNGFYL
jgi:hypothetical protein